MELLHPMRIERWELEPASMGDGTRIGGPGNRFAVRPLHGPITVIEYGDGRANPPHGVLGGAPGFGGGAYVEDVGSGRRTFVSATGAIEVAMGARWVGVSSGGGGYGDPLERDPELVCSDVRDEIITREHAERAFGVVVSEGLEPSVVGPDTKLLRDTLRRGRADIPLIDPTTPSASTWLDDHMGPGDEYLLNPQAGR
jgi:N-methylhydantoinase B